MNETILYKDKKISFTVKGEGFTIVLLHGYIESLDAWGDFALELQKSFRIISIDLPGHGNSEVIDEVQTMESMADAVNSVLEYLQVDNCMMIGHSMGGYVTMEFVAKYAEKLKGYCLFHSTPFEDSDEKKEIRDRLVSSIENGKKIILAKEHVVKTFATENIDKFVEEIGFLKIIAINTSSEGTIAALKGMKVRKNHKKTLENSNLPVLWILGKKDNFISHQTVLSKIKIDHLNIEILNNSGHQGYIEQKEKSIDIVKKFMQNIYS